MMKLYSVMSILFMALFSQVASADYYSCPKKVYSQGWLKKYEYKGNTWAANTKKSGLTSSTIHVSTENSTSSVDPGVSTGQLVSSVQYSSSWGECAMIDQEIAQNMRNDYIDQNLGEIKKQIAQGEGYHIESLAKLSGCANYEMTTWTQKLQARTGEFYDSVDGKAFQKVLDNVIVNDSGLSSACNVAI